MQIFISRNGAQHGPLSFEEVRRRAANGTLTPSDYAWYDGCPEWIELGRFPGVFPSPPPPLNSASAPVTATGTQVRPWPRLWARVIDYLLFSMICGAAFGLLFPGAEILGELSGVITLFLWCFIEPLLLSSWGTTPGKALLNIAVRAADGTKLDYPIALSRSFDVWIRGSGAGIPIVNLITMLVAYNTLTTKGATSWDSCRNSRVTHGAIGWERVVMVVLFFVAFGYVITLSGN